MSLPRDPSKNLSSTPPTARSEGQALPLFDDGPTLDDPKDGPVAIDQESSAGLIGPYRLLEKLGEGGMGQVWLAEQTAPVKRQVALKLIRSGAYDHAVARRFESERQTLAIMEHPTIAKVFDAGSTPSGQPYLVMEYVPGMPITQYCDQKRLSIRERLELFNLVCEGVQHAHQKAIIHRDLKPSNILVVELDGRPAPRIIDFGIAKATIRVFGETSAVDTRRIPHGHSRLHESRASKSWPRRCGYAHGCLFPGSDLVRTSYGEPIPLMPVGGRNSRSTKSCGKYGRRILPTRVHGSSRRRKPPL